MASNLSLVINYLNKTFTYVTFTLHCMPSVNISLCLSLSLLSLYTYLSLYLRNIICKLFIFSHLLFLFLFFSITYRFTRFVFDFLSIWLRDTGSYPLCDLSKYYSYLTFWVRIMYVRMYVSHKNCHDAAMKKLICLLIKYIASFFTIIN